MKIHFGVDYYPEHWPKKRWETDVQLMKEMGVQVVRMAEFSWFKMEPVQGEFHFEWLEEQLHFWIVMGLRQFWVRQQRHRQRGLYTRIQRYSQLIGKEDVDSLVDVTMIASRILFIAHILNSL